jgi:choline dehydrogenase-like flavoprotein
MTGRRYADSHEVDFVVVGSGASGGVIARELSRAGFSVVLMEQGSRHDPADFKHDEFANYFASALTNDPKIAPQTFRKTPADEAKLAPGNFLTYARTVGGSSVHFTANFWRFHPVDFKERSLLGPISGTAFADWPIDYAELEPYYTKVDWEIGVSGLDGASPFEPPHSKPYPMPPLPVKSSGVLFERGARKLGYHPFPAPMAIASQPYRGRSGCLHCGFCMGFGCEARAKSSTLFTVIPEAQATGRCELRTESYVYEVPLSPRGRVTGVAYFDAQRAQRFQKAKAVVLAANGAETPRLLLSSAGPRCPDGLANSSGMVGKHLMFNSGGITFGVFEHELNEYKSVQVTRIAHDWYDADPKRGFYGGGGLDARIGPNPGIWGLISAPPDAKWGKAFKSHLADFPRTTGCFGHTTSLALEANSVSLDPELKDAWGRPAMRVTYKDHPDDLATARFLQDRATEILDAAGARKVWQVPVEEADFSVHLLGTCRMGDDPKRSVIDRFHRSHDVKNLFLCDGSSFVTSGRGQPTMTIQALAFRAADHIARFARRGEI